MLLCKKGSSEMQRISACCTLCIHPGFLSCVLVWNRVGAHLLSCFEPKRIVNYIPDALLCRGADFHQTHFGYNISLTVTKASQLHDVYQFSICCSILHLFFSSWGQTHASMEIQGLAWLACHTLRHSNNLQWYCHPALGCQNMHRTN